MTILSRVNNSTKRALGSVGRPIATAAATGVTVATIGVKANVASLQNIYVVGAISVATAAATEAGLYFFADDTAHKVDATVTQAQKIIQMNPMEFDALCTQLERTLGAEKAAPTIDALSGLRNGKSPNVQATAK